jgi:hypothetical protein
MTTPVFVNHGGLPTEDGHKVLAWVRGLIEAAGRDASKLNGLPGYAKTYLTYVGVSMSAQEWLEEFRHTYANNAYSALMRLEESAQKDAAQQQTNTTLSENLDALQSKLDAALADEMMSLFERLRQDRNLATVFVTHEHPDHLHMESLKIVLQKK